MSPTALSSRIRSLEDRLVTCLFNRTMRRVSLTSAGQEYPSGGDRLAASSTPL